MKQVLAKNFNGVWRARYSLGGHTANVVQCASILAKILGLNEQETLLLKEAAFFHDFGKANTYFQEALTHRIQQPIRHEYLSGYMLWKTKDVLLQTYSEKDFAIILSAVLGHHFKDFEIKQGGGIEVKFLDYAFKHPYFANKYRFHFGVVSMREIKNTFLNIQKFLMLHSCSDMKTIQAALICADAIGSTEYNPSIIKDLFRDSYSTIEDAQTIINKRLGGKKPKNFQSEMEFVANDIVVLEAGCGTGKTLASWHWVKGQISRHGSAKVFHCLPTTGTATEIHFDHTEGVINSDLLHSRSKIDKLLVSGEEEGESDKLDAFSTWTRKHITCTTDTVLGFMSNSRKAQLLLPMFRNAIFVFDEIHCYDDKMFSALISFIKKFYKDFNCKFLLMSASILPWQRHEISRFSPNSITVSSPEIRYQFVVENQNIENLDYGSLVKTHSKILVICNRVKDARNVYKKLKEETPSNFKVFLYHSRFIYKDRFERHREVIDAFKDSTLPTILVATQVAEISLDLSADLLITQLANVPALIQRLGRLNRQYCGKPRLAIFCPDNLPNYPYSHEELKESKRFANTFNVCSQDDLKEYLKRVNTSGRVSTEFERGYHSNTSTPLHKEGYTINCFLKQHMEEIKKTSKLRSFMYLIPMLVNTKNEVAKHNKIPVYSALYSYEFGAE